MARYEQGKSGFDDCVIDQNTKKFLKYEDCVKRLNEQENRIKKLEAFVVDACETMEWDMSQFIIKISQKAEQIKRN